VSVAGGVRADYITTSNRGGYFGDRDTGNAAASGFLSLTAGRYRGFTLTGQVARGFRDPVLSDRYFRGPSGRGFITGNPDLDPESSLQFDAGVRYTQRQVRAAVFAYHYRLTDLIERYQTTPDDFFFRNRGGARLRGVEVESQVDLPWRLTAEIAAQIARGRVQGASTYLDGITTETGSLQVRRSIGDRAFVQARAAWFAEDDRPGPTERLVPGYTLVDLSAGASLGRLLEVRGLIRNLLDDDYLASQDVRAVAAPGRALSLTLVARF
jgi:outer membrane receptor protein involved in Fe transport